MMLYNIIMNSDSNLFLSMKKGTVFDGEVVMHRGNGNKHKARPLFIVFDVLTIGPTAAVLHLPFEKRLEHLRKCHFRTNTANRDMFADSAVADLSIALPLVRKNFVQRTEIVDLLSHVVEEKGSRSYRRLPIHHHLTDGIIFQVRIINCIIDIIFVLNRSDHKTVILYF
jgi:hypothetical protein